MTETKDYNGCFTQEVLDRYPTIELILLANGLSRYPEDKEHYERVKNEIDRRAKKYDH